MKFETVLEYLVGEINSDLDDIQSVVNHPTVSQNFSMHVKEFIASIKDKLNMICE